MASACALKRTRGPNRQKAWRRDPEAPVAVFTLALDVSDPWRRHRVEDLFSSMYQVRRALQRAAVSRIDAFWKASRERAHEGPQAVRKRLGLSKEALERTSYQVLDRAPHLRRDVTKALAMHMADSVWEPVERHLFPDASGRRAGRPGVGRWFGFRCIPGRARSHTKVKKWETFRLCGALAGHRAAYTGSDGRFRQPRHLRPVEPASSWWSYQGPLAVVFSSGLPDGDLVLPVRLPASPSNQAALEHYLADPSKWHKVDLVRRRDPRSPGGWRYQAHLMVLGEPYVSKATKERRQRAVEEVAARAAGIDVNVSNVTVASHVAGDELRVTRIERDAGERERVERQARKERRRQRALERSRRAANPEQYLRSPRQEKEAAARAAVGLPARKAIPRGARKARADGKPLRAFRRDRLSASYHKERAAQAAARASAAQARRDLARRTAAAIVAQHGFQFTVEDCDLRGWARRWGRSLHAFSPGLLLSAIEREARAVSAAGGLVRVPTRTTALSQHCLCGEVVAKALSQREHVCPRCGLIGDRDAVSAALAAFVVLAVPGQPGSAVVDYAVARWSSARPGARQALADTLRLAAKGRHDAPSESTAPGAPSGAATRTPPSVVARQTVGKALCPTPDETGHGRTKPERAQMRSHLSPSGDEDPPPIRDSS